MAYACLVAIMSQGRGAHRAIEKRLTKTAADAGAPVDIVSKLDTRGADAVVLSACVQMPSLAKLGRAVPGMSL